MNGHIKHKIVKEKHDKNKKYETHKYAHKTGGIHMNMMPDTKLGAIAKNVIKQMAQKVSKGDFSVMTLSKPIALTKPIGMLECIANAYTYFSTYLEPALQAPNPIEKMQLVVTAFIAQMHINQSILHSRSPIDSQLGETIQLEKDDGTLFYAESIKAFPPTAIFTLYGPNDQYKVEGIDEIQANIHPTFTEIVCKSLRVNKLIFCDGREYLLTYPQMIVEGILNGDRILNYMDSFTITCKHDKLQAKINLSYDVCKDYKGKVKKIRNKVTGLFWSNKNSNRNDLLEININKMIDLQGAIDEDDKQEFTVARGSGCWLSHVEFDGEILWRINDEVLLWKSQNKLLPSDSTLRQDRIKMLENKDEQAQRERIGIEEQDRRDANLRKKK